jgi:hypothetical protein
MLLALAVLGLAGACVGNGKTPRTDFIDPLPNGMSVRADVVMGCRDGESGFDYRFVVVGPADLSPTGAFVRHLQDREFSRSGRIDDGDGYLTDDLAWVQASYQHQEYPLRVEVGRLDRYLDNPVPRTGPDPATIPDDVKDDAEQYLLVAMRPSDFQCSTPL